MMSSGDKPEALRDRPPSSVPGVIVFLALASGIVIDRVRDQPLAFWLTLAIPLWCVWFSAYRRGKLFFSSCALLSCIGALGAAHHHLFWSTGHVDDISLFAKHERKLIRLTGSVKYEPETIPGQTMSSLAVFPPQERLVCVLQCRSIDDNRGPIPVSGLIRLEIAGMYPRVTVGDDVTVLGWIKRPTGPRNPGGFDYAHFLRSRGIRAVVTTDHPETVDVVHQNRWFDRPAKWRGELRQRYRELFRQTLSETSLPVAQSLFLGDRTLLPHDIQQAFRVTGSMHILAISGLHLGILGLLVWSFTRLINLSTRNSAWLLLVVVWSYALLTNGQPSVIRAGILTSAFVASLLGGSRIRSANVWGIAALAILLRNPLDLFDVGAQLSFIAVAGMIWAGPLALRILTPVDDRDVRLATSSTIVQTMRRCGQFVISGYLISSVVWSVTTPLILGRFHIISPIGLILGVPLNPLVIVTLWSGYLLMFLGLPFPALAHAIGTLLDLGITGLLAVVDWASRVHLGHLYSRGPGTIWLMTFYTLLALSLTLSRRVVPRRIIGWCLGIALLVGLSRGNSSRTDELRCTFLSVGHGCSILIDTPNGRRILFDAGSLHDGRRAAQAVLASLCDRGYPRLDLILLSHTDIDHYNGVPELIDMFPVGQIACPRQFVDFSQPGVEALCDAARDLRIPIKFLQKGDRLRIDSDVDFVVMHPDSISTWKTDNESSLVAGIEFAGRRILLTGDISDGGLDQLLTDPHWDCDVMLAPHHGSLSANTPELARWACPEVVIVSHAQLDTTKKLRGIYGSGADIISTARHGAIAVIIDSSGQLSIDRHDASADE